MKGRKRIYLFLCLVMIVLSGGCSNSKKNNETDTQISRIDAYVSSNSGQAYTLYDTEAIKEIENVIINGLDSEAGTGEELTDLKEKFRLDFYKASVAIIKSEDKMIYSIVAYEDSNIIKLKPAVDSQYLQEFIEDEDVEVFYEVSDEDMEALRDYVKDLSGN